MAERAQTGPENNWTGVNEETHKHGENRDDARGRYSFRVGVVGFMPPRTERAIFLEKHFTHTC